jgi:hypothetical protein
LLAFLAVAARADPGAELEQARRDLAVSEQVLARMKARVESARQDPGVEPSQRQKLEQYLLRVGELVALNRERVEILAREASGQPGGAYGTQTGAAAVPRAATEDEELAELERKLGASLAEFDELLLEEARRARTRASRGPSAGGSSGGSGASPAGGGTAGDGAEAAGAVAAAGGAAEASAAGGAGSGKSSGEEGSPGGRIPGTVPGATGAAAQAPPDVGDGSDDDVVARQIRKAAESETDPELQKKLWEEYRKYKQGTRG